VLHAWKAGPQTVALRRQLEALPGRGVYVLSVPLAPTAARPGRTSAPASVAHYFKQRTAFQGTGARREPGRHLEGAALQARLGGALQGIVGVPANSRVVAVDANAMSVRPSRHGEGDVLNVVPPQRAADIAVKAGLITHNNRWATRLAHVESKRSKASTVLGDATLSADRHAEVRPYGECARQGLRRRGDRADPGREANPSPVMNNTCYSFVSDKE